MRVLPVSARHAPGHSAELAPSTRAWTRGRLAAASLALAVGSATDVAHAAEPNVSLEWNAPAGESCPTTGEVVSQVATLIRSSHSEEVIELHARAVVQKLGSERFHMELTTLADGKPGRRVLDERSCKAMAEATVLILAWMVDPNLAPAPPDTPPPLEKRDESRRAPTPSPSKRPTTEGLGVFVGADLVADVGTLPDASIGTGPLVGLRWKSLRIAAKGAVWSHQTQYLAGSSTAGASFGLLSLGFDACVFPWSVEIGPCALLDIDRLEGTGLGVDTPRTNSSSWLALGVGFIAGVKLTGPLRVMGSVGSLFPTRRERFGLDGLGIVHEPSVVAGRFSVGAELHF